MTFGARLTFVVGVSLVFVPMGYAGCGGDCDDEYRAAIEDCQLQFGDEPSDADDLAMCIQDAREQYRACAEGCADEVD